MTACNSTPPTATPEPTATPSPTELSLVVRTLPPSWTPGVAPTVTRQAREESTPTPLPQVTVEGVKTLPPTWTPFVPPTVTTQPRPAFATFTSVPPTPTSAVSPTRSLSEGPAPVRTNEVFDRQACQAFNPFSRINQYMRPDQSVNIGWYQVEGADSYEIWLSNPDGRFIEHGSVVTAPGELVNYFTFSDKLFVGPGAYAWEVYPLRNRTRLCPSITGTIYINVRY